MRFSRPSILLASVLQATQVAFAFHIELPTRSEAALSNLLARAAPNATSGVVFGNGSYYINITLGGAPFSVSLDTGSSDLWVAGTVPNANSTGVNGSISYATGADEGPIQTAELTLLGYTVPDQAFIAVTPSDDSPEGFGLIGLGPSIGSNILVALNNSAGDPPIDRIFQQNTSLPTFITVLLSRPPANDADETYTGEVTISEVLPLFQNISNQPKVPVTILPQSNLSTFQGFMILLDPDGIIGPDGNAINITSDAPAAPSHDSRQLQVTFDTGDTLPQLPKYIVDAIYSGAKGAKLVNITEFHGDTWVVDCDAELNISFKIGGNTYPIHPLDVTLPAVDDKGKIFCYGAFQAVIPSAENPVRDALLGDSFLSNVYILFNYGDFIDGSTPNSSDPYVQILSTTDPAQAHADFVATRLNGSFAGSTDSPHFNGSGSSKKSYFHKIPILVVVAVVLCFL